MEFINTGIKFGPMFKTREGVAAVRKSLEDATEKTFQELRLASIRSWQDSHNIALD